MITRRSLLKGAAGAVGALALAPVARLPLAQEVAKSYPATVILLDQAPGVDDGIYHMGSWIPVSNEMLEDSVQLETYVRDRLAFMCEQRMQGDWS